MAQEDIDLRNQAEAIDQQYRGVVKASQNNLVPLQRGEREELPFKRRAATFKAQVGGGNSIYLTTGEYEDGRLGEIFLTQSRTGSFARGMVISFAVAVSFGLQYGVPLRDMAAQFRYSTFEPSGIVTGHKGNGEIHFASSVVDWVFQVLQQEYPDQ